MPEEINLGVRVPRGPSMDPALLNFNNTAIPHSTSEMSRIEVSFNGFQVILSFFAILGLHHHIWRFPG